MLCECEWVCVSLANAPLWTSLIDVTVQGFYKFIKFNYKTNKQTSGTEENENDIFVESRFMNRYGTEFFFCYEIIIYVPPVKLTV